MHPNIERVVTAGAAKGLTIEPREFPAGTKTAVEAAEAIGVTVAEIANSLVFLIDDRPVLVLSSGANRVDTDRLAAAAGASRVERCPADRVRSETGFMIGGVAPFGHERDLRTYCDRGLLDHEIVWASAGTPATCFPIAPDDLVAATAATVSELREGA